MSHDSKFYTMKGTDFRKSDIIVIGPVNNRYQANTFGFDVWMKAGDDNFWIDYPDPNYRAEESKAMAIAQRAALMGALEDAC